MKILNLEQGSDDWKVWRKTGIGASDAPIIMGVSPWTTREELLKSKRHGVLCGKLHVRGRDEEVKSGAMDRGTRMEPIARQLYTDLTGIKLFPVCIVHDEYSWMKASLDGYDPKLRIIIEIKCPNWKDHTYALGGKVTDKYVVQVQHELMVTEYDECHYWSYTDNKIFIGKERAALVIVKSDKEYQRELFEKEQAFWNEVIAK